MKLIKKITLLRSTLLLSTVAIADWTTQEDNWYSVTIDGAKSGWAHELVIEVESETQHIKSTKVQK